MAKILIADDSPTIIDILRFMLESQDYEVVTASDGVEAVQMAYQTNPDLILLDIEMPKMKGYQACRLLKDDVATGHIPIIILTSHDQQKDRFWGMSTGADEYMIKDFEADNFDLFGSIQTLIEKSEKVNIDDGDQTQLMTEEGVLERVNDLLDRELFQSTIVNELAYLAINIFDFDKTIESVLHLLGNICEFNVASIYLVDDPEDYWIVYIKQQVINKEMMDVFRQGTIDQCESYSICTQGKTFKTKTLGKIAEIGSSKMDTFWSAPFTIRGAKAGLLSIGSTNSNVLDHQTISTLELFTREASLVVDNAMLFRRLRNLEERTRNLFSKYVPKEVVSEILTRTDDSILVGENREMTILFSDIRNFTGLSEKMEPETIVSMMNEYFSSMSSIVIKHKGILDKYIGDSIMAIFGVPISYEDDPKRAVLAALDMRDELNKLNKGFGEKYGIELKLGIGINTGKAIAGNIGSSERMEYTVVGDIVNATSRIEGLSKRVPNSILIGQSTYEKVNEIVQVKEWELVRVRGKEDLVQVYEVLGLE